MKSKRAHWDWIFLTICVFSQVHYGDEKDKGEAKKGNEKKAQGIPPTSDSMHYSSNSLEHCIYNV